MALGTGRWGSLGPLDGRHPLLCPCFLSAAVAVGVWDVAVPQCGRGLGRAGPWDVGLLALETGTSCWKLQGKLLKLWSPWPWP